MHAASLYNRADIPWEIFAFRQALRNFKRRAAYAAKGEENEIPLF
jgi:hypothetical protein